MPVEPVAIDGVEVFLVSLFRRRYVTYCASHGRYARMNGAARPYRRDDRNVLETSLHDLMTL
jgi:hypothetical protein